MLKYVKNFVDQLFSAKNWKGCKKGKMLNVCLICFKSKMSIKSSNCPLVRTEISISGIIHHIQGSFGGPQLKNSFVQIAKYTFPGISILILLEKIIC